ncbi:MAG: YciI family protein [Chloroflexi bacterium]|nr:YciI family protein [Chloroflexota bacterium]
MIHTEHRERTMKVMMLFMGTTDEATGDPAAMAETYQRIGEWWGQHAAAGTILDGDQLAGPSTARRIDPSPNGPVVTDGPFAEASEVVGGFAMLEVPDMDAAVELAKTWPGGPVEVRPVIGM